MLEAVIEDRAHALGHGLVLQMDALDAAVERVAALAGASHAPVVARFRRKPEAAEPIGGVGQKIVAPPHAADRRAVLECRRSLRHRRQAALPPQHAIHGVLVVERYPAAHLQMTGEIAVRYLRPEWKQKVAEAPGGAAGAGGAVARIGRAP